MPNTEADGIKSVKDKRTSITVELGKSVAEIEEQGYNKGLNDGRNEAWGLARTLYDKKVAEVEKIFDVDGGFWAVIRDFTPQEALAKLKAYEEAQIEVGDVVDVYGDIGVVSSLGTDKDRYHVLFLDGITNVYGKTIPIKKTGKHIDIKSILESIGE